MMETPLEPQANEAIASDASLHMLMIPDDCKINGKKSSCAHKVTTSRGEKKEKGKKAIITYIC